MKKHFFVLGLAALMLAACGSTPSKKTPADPGDPAVFAMIEKGRNRDAKTFFSGDESIDIRDSRNRTALHAAAEANNVEMVHFLLAMGAKVDLLDDEERTALGIAAANFNPETTRLLAGAGSKIHLPLSAEDPDTPALLGARAGGAFLDALLVPAVQNTQDSKGLTLLHLASREGKAGSVVLIIEKAKELVNRQDSGGKTALDYALAADSIEHAETAERLVLAGAYSTNPFYTYFAPAARSANYNIRISDGYTALHYAAYSGFTGYINFILSKKADINIKNNSGATPLHEAYRKGNLEIAKLLIAQGANVNEQDAKGNAPLHLAVPEELHKEAIAMLLEKEANLNLRDEHGDTPFHVIVTLGRSKDIAETLLSGGSEVNIRNIEGKTSLYLAVEFNRADIIPLLIERNADIFAADNKNVTPLERALRENNLAVLDQLLTEETVLLSDSAGSTPLHIAVAKKADVSVIELILRKGGEVNARNKEGNTPLHLANIENYEQAGNLLVSRNADIFAPNSRGESPLYLALHLNPAREWMLIPKTLEEKDSQGNTAFHYAAQWKLAHHVPLLVRRGAKLEAANATGETPLFVASRANSPETIRALLAAGALIGARDVHGNSPLHCAVRWNASHSIDPLISAGNTINAQNLSGKSPLHESVRLSLGAMETALINRKANLEIRDNEGNTPLMEAVTGGFPGSVERLLHAGADPITRNNIGDTPLHISVSLQRRDLATQLLNYGALIHARNNAKQTPFNIALSTSPEMAATLLTKDRITMADDDGLSPLHIAIIQGASKDVIRTIIERGCRVSAVDSEGRTPLRLALDMKAMEEVKMLVEARSDVFTPAADGRTPAALALINGEEAVKALFSGAAINVQDGTGNTVLHYAAQSGNAGMITVLLSLGANKGLRNIAAESPADIAVRWNHEQAAALLR